MGYNSPNRSAGSFLRETRQSSKLLLCIDLDTPSNLKDRQDFLASKPLIHQAWQNTTGTLDKPLGLPCNSFRSRRYSNLPAHMPPNRKFDPTGPVNNWEQEKCEKMS